MSENPNLDDLSPQERAQVLLARVKRDQSGGPVSSENGIDHRHEQETERPAVTGPPAGTYDLDLIPQVEAYQRSPEQQKLDALIDGLDIVEAYRRFIGKMEPKVGSRTESIMISCPFPGHADNNPSAWLNSEKKTWFCGGCQAGGDIYDLAAIHFGFDLHHYKSKDQFPLLRERIGEAYGLVVVKDRISGQEFVVESGPSEEPGGEPTADSSSDPEPDQAPSNVISLHSVPNIEGDEEQTEAERELENDLFAPDIQTHPDLYIPWERIAMPGTYLEEWMNSTTIDDLPHEYYFWLGLMGLGFAAGMNNVLMDYRPVKANLYVCLYGRTGIGKSRAIEPFRDLLMETFPYEEDPYADPNGVKLLPTPNSAEAIIDSFHYEVKDPSTQRIERMASVSALMRHEELSGLIKKSERSGSSIKEVLIELYDAHGNDVSTHSRSSGVKKAHSPFAQMLTTTQPNAIHAFLRKTDVESGFLNRYIFAGGRGRIEPVAYGGVTHDVSHAASLLKGVSAYASVGHQFYLQGAALEVWSDFFRKELADYKAGRVDQESIFSRVDLTLKKVIVMLTVNEMQPQPTPEIIERALILYPYLRVTYSMFAKDIAFNDIADCQQSVIAVCKRMMKKNTHATARDFYRYLNNKFEAEMITKAVKNLTDVGLLEVMPPPAGYRGKPTVRYVLSA